YGIDMPEKKQLIASDKSIKEIQEFLAIDSLGYLSIEGLLSSVEKTKKNFCTACFTGDYPIV
ncbi:MAG: amidophosphoribosyltransferase, partial [Chitinivibrionales bacterium]|nr:amidophosphoribosyltransferase [Chitinivibrionales bacterium]